MGDKEPGFLTVAKLPYWPHMLTQTVKPKKDMQASLFWDSSSVAELRAEFTHFLSFYKMAASAA